MTPFKALACLSVSLYFLSTFFGSVALADQVLINGAGATFPYPIYSKWFAEFHNVDPTVDINYQSIGSGGGIRQLLDKTIDFGASDAPMTDEQLAKANPPILHIPTVMGAVVITYNLPAVKQPLKLTGELIADLFMGKIENWNDPALVKLNPELAEVKDTPVIVTHRSDGSGTTMVFSDYLSKVSPEWKLKVGAGNALKWPVGLGGKGNEGVTGLVKQAPGSIGYTELSYSSNNRLPVAQVKNKDGNFVMPSAKAVTAAANSFIKNMPKDFRISITDASGKDSYPLSSFTYILVYQTMDAKKGQKFISFLNWALGDGQKLAEPLTYAPLPKALVGQVKQKIKEVKTQ
jgi:phosphate transport system substrate-binding protein